ncbi:hypothetical protein GCM10011574_66810 [Microbispora bryophytorum]|uniref:Uncharacterized protein n=1 Tax=Microbispora bryophytorum TaxID=1460882 RepID=A0A8H9H603_9ACTN|nr:hypothetical protein GCM10011574_66810 [Microbispora bryophytorum]
MHGQAWENTLRKTKLWENTLRENTKLREIERACGNGRLRETGRAREDVERRGAGEGVRGPAGGFPTGRRRARRQARDHRPTPRRWPEPSACGC